MSCIKKIKEASVSYTENEKLIAKYILENRMDVLNMSAQVLGERTNTSSAAIIRFSKKLGYKGFTQLKVDLARSVDEDELDLDNILDTNDTMNTLMKKSFQSNLRTIESTYKLLSEKDLQNAVELIDKAKTIYLFGVGGSSTICSDFQYKLMRIGKQVLYSKDMHVQLMFTTAATKDDLVIFVSYSGKTKEILTAAKWAKKMEIPSIAITQFTINPLTKLSDISLGVPNDEKPLRIGAISSRISSLIITDLLYYGVSKIDIERTKEKLILTKDIIKEIE